MTFSDDGFVALALFIFLYIIIIVSRRLHEKFKRLRDSRDGNVESIDGEIVIVPEIFVVDCPALHEEEVKVQRTPKQSYDNLAPPLYFAEYDRKISGSYELPPGYPIAFEK